MTAARDELALRREADAIAARRTDAIRSVDECKAMHPATLSKQIPSHVALLHRVAAFITAEWLPPATVRITPAAEVFVDATGEPQVENAVRRWAAAIEQPVTEAPTEINGWAATTWSASGYHDAVWFDITGTVLHPTPIVDRFGVGLPS